MKIYQAVLMLLSVPPLVVGWVFAIAGIYYLGSSVFDYPTNEQNTSLAAIWAFIFSFGAISISGVLAAKAKFAGRTNVRRIYKYSIIISAVLFLGYMVIGLGGTVIHAAIGG